VFHHCISTAGRFDHLAAAAWMLLPIPLSRQSFGRGLLRLCKE